MTIVIEPGMAFGPSAAEDAWCDIVECATSDAAADLIDTVENEAAKITDPETFYITCMNVIAQKLRSGEYPAAELTFRLNNNYFWGE